MRILYLLILPAISGILTQLSLAPAHLYVLSFFALIPFFISLNRLETLKEKLLVGLFTGFFANLSGFYWMVLVFKNFFSYSENQSVGIFLLYCLVGHLQFLLFSCFYHFLSKKQYFKNTSLSIIFKMITIAFAYSIIDFLTPKLFGDTLGNAFDNESSLRQLSKFSGISFLTFICALANYSFFTDLLLKKIKYSIICCGFISVCWGIGHLENERQVSKVTASKNYIKVAVIQPNTRGIDKIQVDHGVWETKKSLARHLLSMSKEALDKNKDIDLIIWPETAHPAFFTNPLSKIDVEMNNSLRSFVLNNHVPVLFGLTDRDNDGKIYNSAILIQEENQVIKFEVYHKVILAFMGEYNPFAKKTKTSLEVGDHPVIFTLNTKNKKQVKISPIVCYEALSSLYVKSAKKLNPDIIVHISNEAWFGYFGLPQSFLALSLFRAIESEIPMIKAANSGLSALILPNGDVKNMGQVNQEEVIIMEVPLVQH